MLSQTKTEEIMEKGNTNLKKVPTSSVFKGRTASRCDGPP